MIELTARETDSDRPSAPKDGTAYKMRFSLNDSDYAVDNSQPYVVETRSGLRRLHSSLEIVEGECKGFLVFSDLTLPRQCQKSEMQLTGGQLTACDIGEKLLREIVLSARGKDPRERNASEKIEKWTDLDGLTFWGVLRSEEYAGKTRRALARAVAAPKAQNNFVPSQSQEKSAAPFVAPAQSQPASIMPWDRVPF